MSMCGFIYQVLLIYNQFMSGKTIVSIKMGNNQEQKPPAVTIRYPVLFSMELAGKFHPGFTEINKKYQELLQNISYNNILQQFYSESFHNCTDVKLKHNGLDMIELFDKISVKYKNLNGSLTMRFNFYGIIKNKTLPGDFLIKLNKARQFYSYFGEPFETISIMQMIGAHENNFQDYTKYLTFFTSVQEAWRNMDLILETIRVNLLFAAKSYIQTENPYFQTEIIIIFQYIT